LGYHGDRVIGLRDGSQESRAGGLGECENLKFESGVGRKAVGEGVSRESAKAIIFQKFRPDPGFLDCGGLTPLWIFPSTRSLAIQSSVKPEHSRIPSFPQNVFGNCTTWARELTENLLLPFLRAFAASREIPHEALRLLLA
jgi:hypothetical protein